MVKKTTTVVARGSERGRKDEVKHMGFLKHETILYDTAMMDT